MRSTRLKVANKIYLGWLPTGAQRAGAEVQIAVGNGQPNVSLFLATVRNDYVSCTLHFSSLGMS